MRRLPRIPPSALVLGLVATVWACAAAPPAGSAADYQMWLHFEEAGRIQAAMILGDLATARRAANALSTAQEIPGIGPEGAPYIRQLAVWGRTVRDAPTFGEAAVATGQLAATCGACHESLDGGVKFTHSPPPEDRGFSGHMILHSWGADRMWEGLMMPSLATWLEGAGVFQEAPLAADAVTPAGEAYARRLHELGQEALELRDLRRQAVQYGRILEQCAGCHAELGVNRRPDGPLGPRAPTGR